MRRAILSLMILGGVAACRQETHSDAVRAAYENRAAAVDDRAAAQPTAAARKIYEAHADALREEGRDREKGLEGGTPSPSRGGSGGETSGN